MGKESRRKERKTREQKKIVLNVSKKNLIIRAIIAGSCLLLGSIFLVHSCSQLGNNSENLDITYPTFNNASDEEETLFNEKVNIQYYYNSNYVEEEKKETINKINNILENMIDYHKLFDYDDLYINNQKYIHNLKYINDHPNTWIDVDLKLYNVLKEADELNKSTNGKYSIFSGKLYKEWETIIEEIHLYGTNTIYDKDPLYNEYYREEISSIVKSINNSSTSLEFNDDTKEVRFNVNDEDKDNIILDLGLLEYTSYIDYMKPIFIDENLTSGMISSLGMVATLGNNLESGYYQINSVSLQTFYNQDQSLIYDYSFAYDTALNGLMFNPMLNISLHNDNDNNMYSFFDEFNNIIVRSMIINSKTGYSNFSVHSSFTFSNKKDLSYQLKDNYNLYFNEEDDYGYNYLLDYDYKLEYESLPNEEKNIYKYGAMVVYNDGNTNISTNGATTLLYSSLIDKYFEEEYIPYVKVSEVVKTKIMATKGE